MNTVLVESEETNEFLQKLFQNVKMQQQVIASNFLLIINECKDEDRFRNLSFQTQRALAILQGFQKRMDEAKKDFFQENSPKVFFSTKNVSSNNQIKS